MTELNDWWWVTEDAKRFTRPGTGYLEEGETIPSRVEAMIDNAYKILRLQAIENGSNPDVFFGWKDKMLHYAARGYYSFATPEWANFGRKTGLPISCNGCYIEDSVDSFADKLKEVAIQSKYGAGTSAFFGALRPRGSRISDGGIAAGPAHFVPPFEVVVDTISQGNARRGSMAVTLPVEHPDFSEWLQFRDEGSPVQRLSLGCTITDEWMTEMLREDPKHPVKKKIWADIVKKRYRSGYPYIFFHDTVNNNAPEAYKGRYTIWASNLCQEITQPATPEWSFACCLASMNLYMYDEWKQTDAVAYLVDFLDAVLYEYIQKAKDIPGMEASVKFARENLAIGIGTLGLHSLFQSKMLPFDSLEAEALDLEAHRFIQQSAVEESRWLAKILGRPLVCKDLDRRHATLTSIAPTTSSAFILGGMSGGIEPENSNYYTKDFAKGKFTVKNRFLKKLLETLGRDTPEVWKSILVHGGSVQHLDWLTDIERDVFKTFGEINQSEIVIRAAKRQTWVEQSQSLNIMIHPDTPPKEVSDLLILAWELGVKTMYYQRSSNPAQEFVRGLVSCEACSA